MNRNKEIKLAINTLKEINLLDKNIVNFLNKNKIINFSNIYKESKSYELIKFAFFNDSIRNGNIDIYVLENFYISFRKTISNYAKYENNFITKMLNLLKGLDEIQKEMRKLLYQYVFSFEHFLEKFLYKKIITLEINFSLILKEILNEENEDIENKLDLIYISKRLHNFSFYNKIMILKFLWKRNYINLNEISDYGFIHKGKLNQLRKIRYKKYQNLNEKDKIIFEQFIIPMFNKTRKYRNRISHLNDLIMKKEKINFLFNYLNNQEDFLRNGVAKELILDIKYFLRNSNYVKKNLYLNQYFEKFFFYKEN